MLNLTQHAQERMDERDITIPMVAAVVLSGVPCRGIIPSTRHWNLCGITVVSGSNGYIITVWDRDGRPKGRISPKRLARIPGQLRRKYSREQRIYSGFNW